MHVKTGIFEDHEEQRLQLISSSSRPVMEHIRLLIDVLSFRTHASQPKRATGPRRRDLKSSKSLRRVLIIAMITCQNCSCALNVAPNLRFH